MRGAFYAKSIGVAARGLIGIHKFEHDHPAFARWKEINQEMLYVPQCLWHIINILLRISIHIYTRI